MGIYADINADLKEAMDDDLSDATATLTISEEASSDEYDPLTGGLSASAFVPVNMRCLIVGPDSNDGKPDSDTTNNFLEILVLDTEKTADFKVGQLATVRSLNYEVSKYDVDPARATHTMMLRRR